MSKVWSWGIAALVAAGTVPAVNAHEPAKTASASSSLAPTALEATAVVDAFHAALDHGNEVDALALLADDVLIFERGGADRSKAERSEERRVGKEGVRRCRSGRAAVH